MDIFGDDDFSSAAPAPTVMESTPSASLEAQLGDIVERKVRQESPSNVSSIYIRKV